MTTEELRELDRANTLDATKKVDPADLALDEEDEFLKELRQLAGMDEAKPASPIGAAGAGKATSMPDPASYRQPAPQRPIRRDETPLDYHPQPYETEDEVEEDYFFAGWQKGLMLLVASAAVLIMTVVGVMNGLNL